MTNLELTGDGKEIALATWWLFCPDRHRWLKGFNEARYGDKGAKAPFARVDFNGVWDMGFRCGLLQR